MKKKSLYLLIIVIAATLLLILGGTQVNAGDYADSGDYEEQKISNDGDWKYVETGEETVKITKYMGDSEKIIVPHAINGKDVTYIAENAFDFEELTSIKAIVFYNWTNNDWRYGISYIDINENAFINTDTLEVDTEFAFYVITDEEQDISLAAKLFDCTSLNTYAGMPYFYSDKNGVTYDTDAEKILVNAIYSEDVCVKIPSEFPYMNDNDFWTTYTVDRIDCECGEVNIIKALTLEFPDTINTITDTYFDGYSKLRKVTIPSSVSYMDEDIFNYNTILYCYVGYPVRYAKKNYYDYVVMNIEDKVDLSEEYENAASDMIFNIDTSSAYPYEYKDRNITITEWYGYTLEENTDYWWYDDGEGMLYIFGEGNYLGELYIPYTVKKQDISKVKIDVNTKDVVYTGKAITKSIELRTNNYYYLCEGYDYTVSYKNNKNTGKATITIKGKGNFTGTVTKTFRIIPKKATISSVKNVSKKSAKVTWKKDTQASGYEIYMATSKNGKYSKVKTVTKNSTVTYTKKSLKKNKTYYFKVRSYKTIDGKKVYGSYSSVKSVKIKK